jgi:uncharacterized protein (TIGR02266 family)
MGGKKKNRKQRFRIQSGSSDAKKEVERSERRGTVLEVDIDLASDSCFFRGLADDALDGGVFVSTWRELEVGSEVLLELSLPNGRASARGFVMWRRDASDSSPPGVGVAFDPLDDEGKELVRQFCEQREPLYYELDLTG